LDLALLASALRKVPYVDTFCTWMYGTATCVIVGPRASIYGDVQCRKAHSLCVQQRILLARTRAAMYGAVSRCMSTQDTADAKIICYRNLLLQFVA